VKAINKEDRKLCICVCVCVCQLSLNNTGTLTVPPAVDTHHLQMSAAAAATDTLTSPKQTVPCQSGCTMHCYIRFQKYPLALSSFWCCLCAQQQLLLFIWLFSRYSVLCIDVSERPTASTYHPPLYCTPLDQ